MVCGECLQGARKVSARCLERSVKCFDDTSKKFQIQKIIYPNFFAHNYFSPKCILGTNNIWIYLVALFLDLKFCGMQYWIQNNFLINFFLFPDLLGQKCF